MNIKKSTFEQMQRDALHNKETVIRLERKRDQLEAENNRLSDLLSERHKALAFAETIALKLADGLKRGC